jgi:hypothetical protein
VRASAGSASISSVNFSTGMGMNQEYGGPTLLAPPRMTQQAKKHPETLRPSQSGGTVEEQVENSSFPIAGHRDADRPRFLTDEP